MLHRLFLRLRPEEWARQLGMAMLSDPVIHPYLRYVSQYLDYNRFLLAHRALWEQSARFEQFYHPQISRLAQRIATQRGLDSGSTQAWDACYSTIMQQLKDILWGVWEQRVGLEAMYTDVRWKEQTRSVAPAAPKPLTPADPTLAEPIAPLPPANP